MGYYRKNARDTVIAWGEVVEIIGIICFFSVLLR